MADVKISALAALTAPASGDLIPIVDTSAVATKALDYQHFVDLRDNAVGLDTTGATDMTAAIQAIIDAAGSNSYIMLPQGTLLMNSGVTNTQPGVTLGGGGNGTILNFMPSADAVCLDWTLTQQPGGFENLFFTSTDTTWKKTAMKFTDGSNFLIHNCRVGVFPDYWSNPDLASDKNSCIGIHSNGRECCTFSFIRIFANRPVVMDDNPNSYLDVDQFHFFDTYLVPTASTPASYNPCIEVLDGVNVFNLTIDGFNAWALGGYGFYWNSPSASQNSYNIKISGIRKEQGVEAASDGWVIYINHAYAIQNLFIDNVYGDVGLSNCVYVAGALNLKIDNTRATGAGGVPLQIVNSAQTEIQYLEWNNCVWGTGTDDGILPAGLRLIDGNNSWSSTTPLPHSAKYRLRKPQPQNELGRIVTDNVRTEFFAVDLQPPVTQNFVVDAVAKTITAASGTPFANIAAGDTIYLDGTLNNLHQMVDSATDTVLTCSGLALVTATESATVIHGFPIPARTARKAMRTRIVCGAPDESSGLQATSLEVALGIGGAACIVNETDATVFSAEEIGSTAPPAAGVHQYTTYTNPGRVFCNRTTGTALVSFLIEQIWYI